MTPQVPAETCLASDEVLERLSHSVFQMAVARIRNTEIARELTQDTMTAVVSALRAGRVRDTGKLPAFAHGTARNLINSYFRSRGLRPVHEPISPDLIVSDSRETLERSETAALVWQGLSQFSGNDREILLMTLLGLKPAQMAERLHLRSEVVRQRKSRAVRTLAKALRGAPALPRKAL